MQRCRIIRSDTTGCDVYYIAGYRYWYVLSACRDCGARLPCLQSTVGAAHWRNIHRSKLILNRDQLVKYFGFPLPELEIIYHFCAKGCRKIRDAEFLEDIGYFDLLSLLRAPPQSNFTPGKNPVYPYSNIIIA